MEKLIANYSSEEDKDEDIPIKKRRKVEEKEVISLKSALAYIPKR